MSPLILRALLAATMSQSLMSQRVDDPPEVIAFHKERAVAKRLRKFHRGPGFARGTEVRS